MGHGELASHRKQICFVVDKEIAGRLDNVAGAFFMTRSQLIARMLEDYLPLEEKQAQERMNKRKAVRKSGIKDNEDD